MSDVSEPATHPDDELVTRKILREELASYATKQDLANHPTKQDLAEELSKFATKQDLANHPTKQDLANALRGLEESIRSWIVPLFEPTKDDPERIQRLERRSEGHEARITSLEAPRRTRRKPATRRAPKRKRR